MKKCKAYEVQKGEAFAYFGRFLIDAALYELDDLAEVLEISKAEVQALLVGEQQLSQETLIRLATMYYSYFDCYSTPTHHRSTLHC